MLKSLFHVTEDEATCEIINFGYKDAIFIKLTINYISTSTMYPQGTYFYQDGFQ